MKDTLIYDLWGMIIAWCLYLNGYILLSVLLAMACGLYLAVMEGEVLKQKELLAFVCIYVAMLCLYYTSSIPYFFPSLHIFMAAMMFNAAVCYGLYGKMKRKDLVKILGFVSLAFLAVFILISFVPGEDYTLFGRSSLYLMESFIFLPYQIPMLYRHVTRTVKVMNLKAVKKGTAM